ncbi:hypothetical protein GF322_04445 [Candidatus Dependentiae bacterium]|nr:hypothetical protein [Candidatus Dependentiae bacterium]
MNFESIFIFFIYQLFQLLVFPFFLLYLFIRKLQGKSVVGNFWHRNGFVPIVDKQRIINKKVVWIHAVSVGEILSVQDLIKQLKIKNKNIICYVTTGTEMGKKIAHQNLDADFISFLPYDFLFSMFLAFKRIKPSSLIIIEAEIWPNMLMLSKWFNIFTYLLNARISKRSKNKYLMLKFIFKPLFSIFKFIFIQSKSDKINFEKMNIKEEKLQVLGNIKTLNVLKKKEELIEKHSEYLTRPKYPTLLVGSIHPEEIDIYLELFKNLKPNFPELKLILAPRHFFWKEELIKKIDDKFLLWDEKLKLDFKLLAQNIFDKYEILLVFKLGELFKLYQLCNIFYLGGTFVPIGGHNLLEPAVWAKVSIIGPYYHNCKDIADRLENQNALLKIKSKNDLIKQTIFLLNNKKLSEQMGENALNWLESESLKVQKKINYLLDLL